MADAGKTGDVNISERSTAPKAPTVEIPASLSVKQLAELLRITPIEAIKQLMRSGIMANINQVIDYKLAAAIAKSFGYTPKPKPKITKGLGTAREIKRQIKKEEKRGGLQPRPPVVTIMGHVDHGKTKLLDAIRQSNVVDTEAGGITQHIGAYQVEVNGKKITFLDTPGHEAFTAMRARGAQITDIAVLVVAADDGVQPQTLEAIAHAKAAGVPIIVAINKIDKPEANPDLVKQQLAEAELLVEEWGGDVISLPVSAKEKRGISELLENILLVAEMEELKGNPLQPAVGVVIEAQLDKFKGPLATVLIQNGTLKLGDTMVVGTTWGRVKAMFNDLGKQVKKADPATPVEVLGLSEVPGVGDILTGVADEARARVLIQKRQAQTKQAKALRLDTFYDQIKTGQVKELNIILKTDVQGSIEPIRTSLERLSTEVVKVSIIHASTGNINENDVMLSIASNALIIGFNAGVEPGARMLADTKGIDIRNYDIIYTIVDDVQKALQGLLEPVVVEVVEGRAEIRVVFPAAKAAKVAGSYVTEGTVKRNAQVRVLRKNKVVAESTVGSLRRFKEDVKEVAAGFECGMGLKDFHDFQEGDILEFFRKEKSSQS
ncbi:MAG: translation initiation factor IF-2 [Dehalococcoidia bacterium]|nr:translation initiation factor IF-2 [Dehalococcoidia bacterium]